MLGVYIYIYHKYFMSNIIIFKDTLLAHQSSARGGELWLKVVNGPILEDGSGGGGITIIRGEGAVVLEGSIATS